MATGAKWCAAGEKTVSWRSTLLSLLEPGFANELGMAQESTQIEIGMEGRICGERRCRVSQQDPFGAGACEERGDESRLRTFRVNSRLILTPGKEVADTGDIG